LAAILFSQTKVGYRSQQHKRRKRPSNPKWWKQRKEKKGRGLKALDELFKKGDYSISVTRNQKKKISLKVTQSLGKGTQLH